VRVIFGWLSTSKKYALRRWASRAGSPVPRPGRVDDAFKRRVEASLAIELDPTVDVLEQAPHPGDHRVPGAKLSLGVPGFKDPGRHLGRRGLARTGPGGQDADQVGEHCALPGLNELAVLTERGVGLPYR
jgi:hypothetical protein